MDFSRLDKWIDAMGAEFVEDLRNWIAIPSVLSEEAAPGAPFGRPVREMLNQAMADARRYGFSVRDFDGYCCDISMGAGERTLGILGHLDVVPGGDGWSTPPFSLTLRDGRAFGRGVMDDKGPALAALYAMRAVKDCGFQLRDTVRLILGCDEETGMTDMAHYVRTADRLPDYGFSPDAEFPVINIEKGGLHALLSKHASGTSEDGVSVISLYAGERPNVVPGLARAVVGLKNTSVQALRARLAELAKKDARLRISVESVEGDRATLLAEGRSAHASTPDLGVNAAGILLTALAEIGAGGALLPSIRALAEKIGLAGDGRELGIAASDAASGELTCNLGILRFDGESLQAHLDIRYPLCATEETMCGRLVLALSDAGMAVTRLGGHTPHHVPADSEIVQGLIAAYSEVTHKPGYAFAIGGGTYSRCMPNTVAFGPCFPGDTDPCHMPDEWIDLDKMLLSIKIFAHAIVRLACEAERRQA